MSLRALVLVILYSVLISAPTVAAPERRLDDQLKALAADLKELLKSDPKFKGRGVSLGQFTGPKLRGTNFGYRVERALSTELGPIPLHES